MIDYLPSPLDVVDYMGFKPGDETETVTSRAVRMTDMAFSGLAFKIMNDPFVGSLTFTRIYSGDVEQRRHADELDQRARKNASAV